MPGGWPSPAPRWGGQNSALQFPAAAWDPVQGLKTRLPGRLPTRPQGWRFRPLRRVFASLHELELVELVELVGFFGLGIFFLSSAGARVVEALAADYTCGPVTRPVARGKAAVCASET